VREFLGHSLDDREGKESVFISSQARQSDISARPLSAHLVLQASSPSASTSQSSSESLELSDPSESSLESEGGNCWDCQRWAMMTGGGRSWPGPAFAAFLEARKTASS
jgi:hypothetical protein